MDEQVIRPAEVERGLADVTAAELMTPDPETLSPRATVGEALTLMRSLGVRHVPVVAEGRLVGVVDDRLVSAALLTGEGAERSLQVSVDSAMTHYVPQVGPDDDLRRISHLLRTSRCDAVVVVDSDDRLLGLITMVDVVTAVALEGGPSDPPEPG